MPGGRELARKPMCPNRMKGAMTGESGGKYGQRVMGSRLCMSLQTFVAISCLRVFNLRQNTNGWF